MTTQYEPSSRADSGAGGDKDAELDTASANYGAWADNATGSADVATILRPPSTGDGDVDAALGAVAAAQGRGLAHRIEAGEEAQRVLQARLRDLGGA